MWLSRNASWSHATSGISHFLLSICNKSNADSRLLANPNIKGDLVIRRERPPESNCAILITQRPNWLSTKYVLLGRSSACILPSRGLKHCQRWKRLRWRFFWSEIDGRCAEKRMWGLKETTEKEPQKWTHWWPEIYHTIDFLPESDATLNE